MSLTAPSAASEPGSFRDRSSRVFHAGGEVWRALSPRALEAWERLKASGLEAELTSAGQLVASERAEPPPGTAPACGDGAWAGYLRHERVPFVSYPYEWCFGMLRAAALLTLDLLAAALRHGLILKDSSPYNVQWRGARPVFIDLGSFEPLAPGAPWIGYRQFCELFLYPLFLQAYKGVPFQPWLRGSLEGIAAGELARLCSLRDRLRPGVLGHVILQAALQRRLADTQRDLRAELRSAGFHKELIEINVRKLRRLVERLAWEPRASTWSGYADESTYSPSDRERKAAFVRRAAASRPGGLVWDLGANTVEYARVAAEHAGFVVALDADALCVERSFRRLAQEGDRRILPLYGCLTDPAPSQGWRGAERADLAARGRPDLVLALALMHHLVIAAHVPLPDLVEWLAGLGGDLVIEFVSREDPMVQRLLRNKDDVYADYDPALLERCLERSYEVVARESLQGGLRVLYHARRRT